MPKTVTFEGQTYQFPDDASDAEIAGALGGGATPAVAGPSDVSAGNSFLRGLVGAGQRAMELPGEFFTSLKNLATTNPLTTLKNLHEGQMQQFDKAGSEFAQGRTSEGLGHSLAGLIPGLGPAAASIGENVGTGKAENIGRGVVDAALLAQGSGTVRSAEAAAGRALTRAASSPAGRVVSGAVAGGVTGGIPGAITGAAGGGLMGKIEQAVKSLRNEPEAVLDDVKTAVPVERYMPNTPGPRPVKYSGHGVSPDVQAASQAFDRYAPSQPSIGTPMRGKVLDEAGFDTELNAPPTPEFDITDAGRIEPGETAPTVGVEGFGLGPVTPLDQVPTSAAKQAAAAMQRVQRGASEQAPIDWRTTDAVPIDAMNRGGSILEPGESSVGLSEQLAVALKNNDLGEASRLAKAIRQRMHIRESGR